MSTVVDLFLWERDSQFIVFYITGYFTFFSMTVRIFHLNFFKRCHVICSDRIFVINYFY